MQPALPPQHHPLLPTQLDIDGDSDFEKTGEVEGTNQSNLHETTAPDNLPPPTPQNPPTTDPSQTQAVRPIQVGEWLRQAITRRILDSDKAATTRKLLQPRQWGIGVIGGAEATAITHLLIEDMWHTNQLTRPLAVIQVDQKLLRTT